MMQIQNERGPYMSVKRGDIFYADLSPVVGSEQGGLRPVLIVQNDVGNKYSPTVIAAAITSKMGKTHLPTHIDIFAPENGEVQQDQRDQESRPAKETCEQIIDPSAEHADLA